MTFSALFCTVASSSNVLRFITYDFCKRKKQSRLVSKSNNVQVSRPAIIVEATIADNAMYTYQCLPSKEPNKVFLSVQSVGFPRNFDIHQDKTDVLKLVF